MSTFWIHYFSCGSSSMGWKRINVFLFVLFLMVPWHDRLTFGSEVLKVPKNSSPVCLNIETWRMSCETSHLHVNLILLTTLYAATWEQHMTGKGLCEREKADMWIETGNVSVFGGWYSGEDEDRGWCFCEWGFSGHLWPWSVKKASGLVCVYVHPLCVCSVCVAFNRFHCESILTTWDLERKCLILLLNPFLFDIYLIFIDCKCLCDKYSAKTNYVNPSESDFL